MAIPYQIGKRRRIDELVHGLGGVLLVFGLGWVGLGWIGAGLCLAVVVVLWRSRPAAEGVWVISAADLAGRVTIDRSRVTFTKPHRVIYQDEVAARDFARLRRLCLGRSLSD